MLEDNTIPVAFERDSVPTMIEVAAVMHAKKTPMLVPRQTHTKRLTVSVLANTKTVNETINMNIFILITLFFSLS